LHSIIFYIYLCIGYLLVMYGIQKILSGLKVTLLLIIFGIFCSFMLEHNARMKSQRQAFPVMIFQPEVPDAGESDGPSVTDKPDGKVKRVSNPSEASGTGRTHSGLAYGLSDLGLQIEW
jgi:hypothetical protein